MKHARLSKAQKQYVRGIVHNLSLQRWTAHEIADYLRQENDIDIALSSVANIRTNVEKEAEKWYIQLKKSSYKYIANYKERLDSLLSYQRQLQDIITTTKKEDTKVRALSTIASIEMDIFTIWKQLPELDIVDKVKQQEQQQKEGREHEQPPILSVEDVNGLEELPPEVQGTWHDWHQCNSCNRWWSSKELLSYHKNYNQKCPPSSIEY